MMSFLVVSRQPAPGLAFTLTHMSVNSFYVQNTGPSTIRLREVNTNPTSIIAFPAGQLRGSVNSGFIPPYNDWFSAPAIMDIAVSAGGVYYFQFIYGWNTGNTVTVTATDMDGNMSTQKVLMQV